MRDIDYWAATVDELENGINMDEFAEKPLDQLNLVDYARTTPNSLMQKLKDNIKPYDRDFQFKFIDMRSGKQYRNLCLKIEVDDVSEEIKAYVDFK